MTGSSLIGRGFVAALLYAVLAVLLVSPALPPGRTLSASDALWSATPWTDSRPADVPGRGSNTQLGDQYRVFLPFLERTRDTLPHVPLWNPALMAGRPYLANGQSAVFSPFNAPAYVLPFWRSLAPSAALKLLVAALGAYLLGAALGMRFAAALLSGVVFAFSLWFVAWLAWPTTSTWALLPWLWLAAEGVVRRPGLLSACGLALVVGLQFLGGHPESSFHVLVATGVFFCVRLAERRRDVRAAPALARTVGVFGAALVLGAALAALTLLPLVELLANSADSARREGFGGLHSPPRYLLGLFLHDYWGRPASVPVDPFANPFLHTRAYYVGALPLMLAAAALAARRDLGRLALAAGGTVSLGTAVGVPPLPAILELLPGFDVTNNSRLIVVFTLCLALLAGWGLHDLLDPARLLRRGPVLALAVGILAVPLVWVLVAGERPWLSMLDDSLKVAWGFADWPRLYPVGTAAELERLVAETRLAALLEWLVLAGAGAALLWLRVSGRLGTSAFATLALLLVTADLFKAGVGINPAIPIEHADQPVTPSLRYLQERTPNRFVGLRSTLPLSPGNPLPADLAMRYGLLDARGYDFPIEDRYMRFWRREIAPAECAYHFCTSGADGSARALHGLSLLSVADVMTNPGDPAPRAPGLDLAYNGTDAHIYSNTRALPRAFLVERQVVVRDDSQALAKFASANFEPRTTAVTERRVAGVREGAGPASPGGTARLVEYRAERVRIDATARRPSILVLTDTSYPGWKVTVDGEDAPLHRVDYLFRGVQVDAGRHQVEFRYEPASWRIGVAISAGALTLLVVLTGLGLARRRATTMWGVRPLTGDDRAH